MRRMARSLLAVVAGYVVMVVGVIAMTAVAGKLFAGAVPAEGSSTTGYLILNLLYGFAFALLGGYVAGVIARRGPVLHAIAVAVVMVIMAFIAMKTYAGQEPSWYQRGHFGTAIPALFGGWIRARQVSRKAKQSRGRRLCRLLHQHATAPSREHHEQGGCPYVDGETAWS